MSGVRVNDRRWVASTPGADALRAAIPTFRLSCEIHNLVRDELGRCTGCVIAKAARS